MSSLRENLFQRTCSVQDILTQLNQLGVFIKEGNLLFLDGVSRRPGSENKVGERFGNILGGMRGGIIVHELVLMSLIE